MGIAPIYDVALLAVGALIGARARRANAKLDLYNEDIVAWSIKNNNKLYLVNELVKEINGILDTAQGKYKSSYPINAKANDMKNLIISLPEPFKVTRARVLLVKVFIEPFCELSEAVDIFCYPLF